MQGELFGISGTTTEVSSVSTLPQGWMDRFRVTLRLDHLSIIGILALVLYVLVFSFGVEKGKRFALDELKAAQTKQEQIARELNLRNSQTEPQVAGDTTGTHLTTLPSPTLLTLTGKYTIQLITFTNQSKAEKEVERLKQKGFQSFIIPAGKFFQVCIDAFENTDEARQKLIRLKANGFASPDAYIRPLKSAVSP